VDERARQRDSDEHDRPQQDGQQGEEPSGQREGARSSLLHQGLGVGRHERGRQGALREEIAQQVRNAESHLEGVGEQAVAEEGREDLLADEAQEARDQGHRGDEARGPEKARTGRDGPWVDLVSQGRYTNLLLRLRGGVEWHITHRP
jgi:hypothetical protein